MNKIGKLLRDIEKYTEKKKAQIEKIQKKCKHKNTKRRSDEVSIRKINPERLSDFVHTANWPVGIYELSGTLYAMDGTSKNYTETIIIKELLK
jgi:hypothetical protein